MDADAKKMVGDFLASQGVAPRQARWQPIPADGSKRRFWRIGVPWGEQSWIVMSNPPATETLRWENYAYLKIGEHLHQKALPVPRVYRHNLRLGFFILEDMGATNLQDAVAAAPDPIPLYRPVLEVLLNLQVEGARGFKPSWCFQTRHYDSTVMRIYEAHYFRDAFLSRYLGLQKDWSSLEPSFALLAQRVGEAETGFFLHRDFQSRNILVSHRGIGVVDWQGGRLGPLAYDLASLLLDPYTRLTPEQQEALWKHYVGLLEDRSGSWAASVVTSFPYLAVQRNLQVLGAFAHLTRTVGRPHFEEYIPAALHTLRRLLLELDEPGLLPLTELMLDLTLPTLPEKPLDTPNPTR
jgi:hypothetical protein